MRIKKYRLGAFSILALAIITTASCELIGEFLPSPSPSPAAQTAAAILPTPSPSPIVPSSPSPGTSPIPSPGPGIVIADQTVAYESVMRSIPSSYIDAARNNFHILYKHTSHGTHVSMGMSGLMDYKSGDAARYAITLDSATAVPGKLDIHDYYYEGSPPDLSQDGGVDTLDSYGDPLFVGWTRSYLDASANADVNIVMWSWCSIVGHNVQNYLNGMAKLISEYGPGGSKIGSGSGKTHPVPVTFIFMTGHAEGENESPGHPKNQADLILDYCRAHGYYCLDYYGIDSHDMAGNYHPAASDDAVDTASGVAYNANWQNSHALGVDWFYNKDTPGGSVNYGEHMSQYVTANRKAYAMWYILARIAGWSGN